MSKIEPDTITLPISLFVDSHLGINRNIYGQIVEQMWYERALQYDYAFLILEKCQNKHTCLIEMPNPVNKLEQPVLYDLEHRTKNLEHQNRSKAYSEARRVERFILDANVHKLKKEIMIDFALPERLAIPLAYEMIVGNKIAVIELLLKGKKLIEKEDEL